MSKPQKFVICYAIFGEAEFTAETREEAKAMFIKLREECPGILAENGQFDPGPEDEDLIDVLTPEELAVAKMRYTGTDGQLPN